MAEDSTPAQEYFEDQPTDIEKEETESQEEGDQKPWDPNKIRIQTKSFSLKQVVDEIKDGTIDLAPDFQRAYVWRERQKSRLIESILLGIPLPAFYFNAEADGRMQVVDGVQRLTTINTFAIGELAPSDVEYLAELKGKRFEDLAAVWRRRFNQTQIVVHVIDPQTPTDVKFDIFKRINTGGSPLTAQEIRHCMSKRRSREFLKRLAGLEAFHRATGYTLRQEQRMVDRELVLRFIAFRLLKSLQQYEQYKTLDDFLMDVTSKLDNPMDVPDGKLQELEATFDRSMQNATFIFGGHAFRRWPLGNEYRTPLNRALFESWSVALADVERSRLEAEKSRIIEAARRRMKDDLQYINAISASTGHINRVKYRFDIARRIVAGEAE